MERRPQPMGVTTTLTDAIAAIVAQGTHWLATDAYGPLLGCYLGLMLIELGLTKSLAYRIPLAWQKRIDTVRNHVLMTPALKPIWHLAAVLPHLRSSNLRGRPLTERSGPAYAELTLLVSCQVILEELLFFGLPLVLAPTPETAILLLAGTTTLWALGHGATNGVAMLVTTAWLKAILWLSGLAVLSIAAHFGRNFLGMGLKITFGKLTWDDSTAKAVADD